tara:strand:+ start:1858 stop:1959 length:102 start_codon:yes stop_codon:yes gene_type:complete
MFYLCKFAHVGRWSPFALYLIGFLSPERERERE